MKNSKDSVLGLTRGSERDIEHNRWLWNSGFLPPLPFCSITGLQHELRALSSMVTVTSIILIVNPKI